MPFVIASECTLIVAVPILTEKIARLEIPLLAGVPTTDAIPQVPICHFLDKDRIDITIRLKENGLV